MWVWRCLERHAKRVVLSVPKYRALRYFTGFYRGSLARKSLARASFVKISRYGELGLHALAPAIWTTIGDTSTIK